MDLVCDRVICRYLPNHCDSRKRMSGTMVSKWKGRAMEDWKAFLTTHILHASPHLPNFREWRGAARRCGCNHKSDAARLSFSSTM